MVTLLQYCSLTVSIAQGQAVIPTTSTPIIFLRPSSFRLMASAMILNASRFRFPLGPGLSRK